MKKMLKQTVFVEITLFALAAFSFFSCNQMSDAYGEGKISQSELEGLGFFAPRETAVGYEYDFARAESKAAESVTKDGPSLSTLNVEKTAISEAPQMLSTPNDQGEWSMFVPREATLLTIDGITAADATVTVSMPSQNRSAKDSLSFSLESEGATEIHIVVTSNIPLANDEIAYLDSNGDGKTDDEPVVYPSRIYIIKIEKGLLEPVINDQPKWSSISGGTGFSKKTYLKDIDWDDFRLLLLTWTQNQSSGSGTMTWLTKDAKTENPYIQFYVPAKGERGRFMFIYTKNIAYALVMFQRNYDIWPDYGWSPGADWERRLSNDYCSVDRYGGFMNIIFNDEGTPGMQSGRWKMENNMFEDIDPLLKPLASSRLAYIRDLRVCYENRDSDGSWLDGAKTHPEIEKVVDGVPFRPGAGFIDHNVYAVRVPAFVDTVTLTPTSLICYDKDLNEQRLPDYARFTVYNAEPDLSKYIRPYDRSMHETGFFYRDTIYDIGGLYGAWNVKVAPGETKRVDFVITSEDGLHKNTYYVYVTRRWENPFEKKGYSWAKRFTNTTVYMNYTDVETGEKVDTRAKPWASKPEYDGWKYYDLDDVMLVHKAKESLFRDDGKGINVVLMGDGFSQEQSVQGGTWETMALEAAQFFLDTPVIRNYKDYINIWIMFNPCAGEGGVDGFSGPKNRWGASTPNGNVTLDTWSMKWYLKGLFGGENFDRNVIVAFKANGKFGSWAMGWICSGGYNDGYTAKHEFIGHTFANMVDEYGGGTSSEGVSSKPMAEEADPDFKYPYDFDGICTNGIWNTTARDFRKHVKPPAGDAASAWAKTYAYANDPARKYYYFDPNGDKWNNWTGKQIISQDIDLNPEWNNESLAWREWLKEMYLPPWKDFMDHPEFTTKRDYKAPPGYENDKVGIYEGGAGHARGHYRSRPDGVMNNGGTYFSAWQRYIIWAKIQYRSRERNLSDLQMFNLNNPFEGKFVKPEVLKEFLLYDTVNTGRSKAEIEAWWNQYGKYLPSESQLKAPK